MDSDSWITVISIVLLIGCSAFFSASETAISNFNKIRIRKKASEGDKPAKAVLRIWDNYDESISAILVGNNIVNIAMSALATLMFTAALGAARGTLAATLVITLLVLLFGEVLPKSYAKDNADKTALRLAPPLSLIIKILSPLAFLFIKLTLLVRGGKTREVSPSITEEELIYMMDTIEEEGVLEEQERDLVQSALEFDETSLGEILTPRVNIIALDVESEPQKILQVIIDEGFSRIPVYEKSVDNIIGVLYTHDFLLRMLDGRGTPLREMLGEALFVHKGMKLSHLLSSFKAKKLNLAVVVDEYGGTLGIVTMEDVLEELVGDIWDEDDEIPGDMVMVDGSGFESAGGYSLDDMLERLEIDRDSVGSGNSTVGGWALHMLEHIPEIGEKFLFSGYCFTVLEMDGHRLKKLGISPLPPPEEEKPEEEITNGKDLNQI